MLHSIFFGRETYILISFCLIPYGSNQTKVNPDIKLYEGKCLEEEKKVLKEQEGEKNTDDTEAVLV